jgi:alkanesulfonate monooxygenase SsuD/methylene tetrahydromethanopterin reductase-like flavin-dependent oxidoreductase (luciferase family)
MEFSLWPNMSTAPSDVLDLARWAEDHGWYGIWYADHYMPNTGTDTVERGVTHECWGILPAIAAVTERVRIGSLVSPTSVHHPAVLANRASTIDHVSNGRMVLGLGAGWQINEHRAYGIELEPPKQRVDRFEESIQIIRLLMANDLTTFEGKLYTLTEAPSDPPPIQSPLPILVGTGGARMCRITARFADEWNTWGNHAMATSRLATFRAACESVGRDGDAMWTSVQTLVYLTDDDKKAETLRSSKSSGQLIAGSADHLVEQLEWYVGEGFNEFIIPDWNLGKTQAERVESLGRLNDEVIAQLG